MLVSACNISTPAPMSTLLVVANVVALSISKLVIEAGVVPIVRFFTPSVTVTLEDVVPNVIVPPPK